MKKVLIGLLLILGVTSMFGQAYRVGDIYTAPDGSRGIVFYVHPDGSGGWVVALEDASLGCAWGAEGNVPALTDLHPTYMRDMVLDTAGYTNTQVIRAYQQNVAYAAGKVDFEQGWCLPSPAQCHLLFSQLPFISGAIENAGGTTLANDRYWSSAERDDTRAWTLSFGLVNNKAGSFDTLAKTSVCRVRAVRSFTYVPTYAWSTGDTAETITVTPSQTTTYNVTVTTPEGCCGTAQHTVVVNQPANVEIIMSACESYAWNGQTYTVSGDYAQNFTTVDGCDSLVTLHLTVNHGTYDLFTETACEHYTWHGMDFTESGVYAFEYANESGCPSADTLRLTVTHGTHNVEVEMACESYAWHGVAYTNSGVYTHNYLNAFGCESTDTLYLTVFPAFETTVTTSSDTICLGEWAGLQAVQSFSYETPQPEFSYSWNTGDTTPDITVYPAQTTTYSVIVSTEGGCNDTAVHTVVVMFPVAEEINVLSCDSYAWNDQTYIVGGEYTQTFTAANGCDSTVTIVLTMNAHTDSTLNVSVLENSLPYTLNGESYTVPSTYYQTLTNAAGCDSLLTINLTVLYNVYNTVDSTVCENELPLLWNGITCTEEGEYVSLQTSMSGSDSVVYLNLVVNPAYDTLLAVEICQGEHYDFFDEELDTEGEYSQTFHSVDGCDSVISLTLTVNNHTDSLLEVAVLDDELPYILNEVSYDTSGVYIQTLSNAAGCDSLLTIHLTVYHSVTTTLDTTVCANILPLDWLGMTFEDAGTQIANLTTSFGADSVVVATVYVVENPVLWDTIRLSADWLPYEFAAADTIFPVGIPDISSFFWWIPSVDGCDTMVMQTVVVYPSMEASVAGTVNTDCYGRHCFYDGPTIMINEVMLAPSQYDGSIAGSSDTRRGEWIELYNPHKCDSVDISCYFLGNNAKDGVNNHGGGFTLPQGTVVPPQGFCVVRGLRAPAVPSELLVQNGGNVVEVVVSDRYCLGGGSRLWFPNSGGWFAFYDADGVPQDAISWNSTTNSCMSCHPCVPSVTDCGYDGVLASYDEIPSSRKNYISSLNPQNYSGRSFRRVPDGGVWQSVPSTPTYGTCNAECVEPAEVSCNAIAVVTVQGGMPPYSYQWDDAANQTTDTAYALCAGDYSVTVTDAFGMEVVLMVSISDFVPDVAHADASFCLSDTFGVLHGFPSGGFYTGAVVSHDTLFFETNAGSYELSYTYIDSNGCTASTAFQVTVADNLFEMDSVVCADELPLVWYGDTLAQQGEFTHTLTNAAGCDSVVTLHLTVNPTYDTQIAHVMCEGETYDFLGDILTESGVYVDTLPTVDGCDSIITLTLTVNPVYNTPLMHVMCEGETYDFLGDILTESGVYVDTLPTVDGCDSIITLTLTVNPVYDTPLTHVMCEGETYNFFGEELTESGVYVDTLPTINGCDSIVTLTLTVNPVYNTPISCVMCEGETYSFFGETLTESGVYVDTLPTVDGCDSIITLTLTVNPTYNTPLTHVMCEGETYDFFGEILTESGTYVDTFPTVNGCDSVFTLTLAVNPVYNTSLTHVMCEGETYDFLGEVLTESGVYVDTLPTVDGCDSIVTLTLTVTPVYHTPLSHVMCEGEIYNFFGETLTETGVFVDTLPTVDGCDSIITLTLTVNPVYDTPLTHVMCEGETYNFFGEELTESGVYVDTLPTINGCDSIITLTLTVNPVYHTPLTHVMCEGETYDFFGEVLAESGAYVDTLPTVDGCDSIITLTLTVNPVYHTPLTHVMCEGETYNFFGEELTESGVYVDTLPTINGCDSIITLMLTVNPVYNTPLTHVMCEGETYDFFGEVLTESGVYEDTLPTINGCDSIITLTLTVNPVYHTPLTHVMCEGETYDFFGEVLTESGAYVDTLPTVDGCDSIITLTLTVNPVYHTPLTHVMCEGETYNFFGEMLTESGVYVDTLPTINGCDSIIMLTLTVNPVYNTPLTHVMCEGETYNFFGEMLTESGVYVDTLPTINGCDSTITLTLTVNPVYNTPLSHVMCQGESYNFFGEILTESGVYVDTLPTINGCDSIVTLTLTVNPVYNTPLTHVMCEGETYNFFGEMLTESGVYVDTLPTINGCDSIVTLTLTVNPVYVTPMSHVMCEGETYNFFGEMLTESGVYVDTLPTLNGCDSIITLTLTVNPVYNTPLTHVMCEGETYNFFGEELTETGVYADTLPTINGCDSIVTLTLTVNPVYNTSIAYKMCEGETYSFFGEELTETGIYVDTLPTINGCDSIVTLTLTVNPVCHTLITHEMCQGESYNLLGEILTESGVYVDTLPTIDGCDSIITLTLTVNPVTDSAFVVTLVENNLPFTLNGNAYSATGTYFQTLANAAGCDSLITIDLTVYHNVSLLLDTTVCASALPYTWHGHTFTSAGNHTVTMLTSHGADSTVTYNLSVDNISTNIGNITHNLCDGESTGAATATVTGGQTPMNYSWTNATGANVSTTTSISNRPAGTYTFTVTDNLGCTATATVTLNTLNGPLIPGTIASDQDVCDGDIAPFTGTAASGGDNGSYQWQISTNGTDWATAPGTANLQDYTYPDPVVNAFLLRRAWVSQSCGTVYSNAVTVNVWQSFSDTIVAGVCQGDAYQENGFNISADQTAVAGEYTFEMHYAATHCDSAIFLLLTVYPRFEETIEDEICEGGGYNAGGFSISPNETVGVVALERSHTLQTVNGCDSVINLQLTIIDTALDVSMLTENFCEEMSAELTVVTGMTDYVWSTGETAPTILVTSPGLYSVTASQDGCSATAYIHIDICPNTLYLPNAITPSKGDGVNDYFFIPERNQHDLHNFEIFIYNRWGEMVFYSTDKNFRWNGEYRGQIQYQTIYNYVIRYIDSTGHPRLVQGSITVL